MSRYSLKPLPNRADLFEVVVGWDAGFGTYFMIVFGGCNEENDPELKTWWGALPAQITTVLDLRCLVEQYAELHPRLIAQLRADRKASTAHVTPSLSGFLFGLW